MRWGTRNCDGNPHPRFGDSRHAGILRTRDRILKTDDDEPGPIDAASSVEGDVGWSGESVGQTGDRRLDDNSLGGRAA